MCYTLYIYIYIYIYIYKNIYSWFVFIFYYIQNLHLNITTTYYNNSSKELFYLLKCFVLVFIVIVDWDTPTLSLTC